MRVVLATRNAGKVKEVAEFFGRAGWEVESLPQNAPVVIEDGSTFEENALKKASTIHEYLHVAVLADDSGLEVDALEGAPGVFSARFAGEDATDDENNRKLLDTMYSVPEDKRTARFVSVLALVQPGFDPVIVRGTCEGRILIEARGDGGFGYDPLFMLDGEERTMAELSLEEKNQISHRAQAMRLLIKQL